MANGILLAIRKESFKRSLSSHTLRSAFSQDQRISENMTCMSTPRQSSQEKLSVVWTSAIMLVWHHRELGEGGCRSQGPGSRHLPAPRPPWLPSSWASPFGAKMMAAGLGSLFSRRRVHRQKMAVCPGFYQSSSTISKSA